MNHHSFCNSSAAPRQASKSDREVQMSPARRERDWGRSRASRGRGAGITALGSPSGGRRGRRALAGGHSAHQGHRGRAPRRADGRGVLELRTSSSRRSIHRARGAAPRRAQFESARRAEPRAHVLQVAALRARLGPQAQPLLGTSWPSRPSTTRRWWRWPMRRRAPTIGPRSRPRPSRARGSCAPRWRSCSRTPTSFSRRPRPRRGRFNVRATALIRAARRWGLFAAAWLARP